VCVRGRHISTKKPPIAILAAIRMQAEQWENGPFEQALFVRVSDPPAATVRTKLFTTHRMAPFQRQAQILTDRRPEWVKMSRTQEFGLSLHRPGATYPAHAPSSRLSERPGSSPIASRRCHTDAQPREKSGFVEFHEETSALTLSKFAKDERQFDLIFIDWNHKFDSAIIDFSLAAPVCALNGYIVLDDAWMPAIKKALAFIRLNRKDFSEIPSLLPSVAVFRKTGTDERKWDHFVQF
jgi:hypothetical protein